jgi:hypothetical protein
MNLINVDGAIEDTNEQIEDITQVLNMYYTIRKNLITFNKSGGTNKALHEAGFDDKQIDTFFEILTK